MSNNFFDDYIKFTRTTAVYPLIQTDPKIIEALYLGNGLASEVGEVCGLIKKTHRDVDVPSLQDKMTKEIGDCMWYIGRLCDLFNIDMEDMLKTNVTKLQDRKDRNQLHGSGDDR